MSGVGETIMAPLQAAGTDVENWWNSLWAKTKTDTTKGTADVVGAEAGGLGPMATTSLDIGGTVSNNLGSALWSKLSTGAQAGLTSMGTVVGTGLGAVQTLLTAGGSQMSADLEPAWSEIESGTQTAVLGIGVAVQTVPPILGTVAASVESAGGQIVAGIGRAVPGFSSFAEGVETAAGTVSSVMGEMQSSVDSALGGIASQFTNMVNELISSAQGLWAALVGHSIWTDMLDMMVSQTHDSLAEIQSSFKDVLSGLPNTVAVTASVQGAAAGAGATVTAAGTSSVGGAQVPIQIQNDTVLQLDGTTIAQITEQKMIQRQRLGTAYKGR
jgi:hypothetical protein